MALVLTKQIRCSNCDGTVPLLASSLERITKGQSGSSMDEPPLFFACPRCKLVVQADISSQSEHVAIPEGQRHPDDKFPFGVLLECGQRDCKSRIAILGIAKSGMVQSQAQTLCRTWRFGREVKCDDGHDPMRPAQIAGLDWKE